MRKVQGQKEQAEIIDLQNISNALEQLPRDKLMYVAGAITALAATSHAISNIVPDQQVTMKQE